jgi:SAM-dependent methyltransferase
MAKVALNIGCGALHKQSDEDFKWVNLDWVEPADVVVDVRDGLPYEDDYVDYAEADNLLEHLDNEEFMFVLNDWHRVIKPDGKLWFKVPDALHWMDGAFGDPTHKRFFVPRSFLYFDVDSPTGKNYGQPYGFKPWKIHKLETDNKFFTCIMSPVK